jgi:hypothetical protein
VITPKREPATSAIGHFTALCLGKESMKSNSDSFGAYLSIDHRTPFEIAVNLRDRFAELRCRGLELKMQETALVRLIEVCEEARGEIDAKSNATLDGQTFTTRVECDSETPLTWSSVGDAVELRWGNIVMTVTGPALVALIKGARIARSGLEQLPVFVRDDTENASLSNRE